MSCRMMGICNQKSGVGKTVSTVNLGIGLAREGKKVLLVDVDSQGSLTASLAGQVGCDTGNAHEQNHYGRASRRL